MKNIKNTTKLLMLAVLATSSTIAVTTPAIAKEQKEVFTDKQIEIQKKVTAKNTGNILIKDIAESYTNVDKFYNKYASDFKGISSELVYDEDYPDIFAKNVLVTINLNEITKNLNKKLPTNNPLSEIVKMFLSDLDYLEALKSLTINDEAYLYQNILPDLENSNYTIKTGLHIGDLTTEESLDVIDMIRYPSNNRTFSDIATHYAKEHILNLARMGVVNGYDNGKYGVNDELTRGQFAGMLARTIPNADTMEITSSFNDISNHWAKDDIILLNQMGIVEGTTATTFKPHNKITRQQAATMLIRYIEAIDLVVDADTTLTFADSSKIDNYAKDSVGKLVSLGVISGKPGNVFDPRGNLTRGQMAKMLDGTLQLTIRN